MPPKKAPVKKVLPVRKIKNLSESSYSDSESGSSYSDSELGSESYSDSYSSSDYSSEEN